ncbi:hypothetical protein SUH3_07630 [Pseudosulfitobacter pseudonitzschiae]|uniref:Uncharacterized protein n=1 Tax=Pseudosulfitobacter pseudonitzschiae TaxID=1402135 RepID=A0A073J944_9RHOB|nr:hypothetical protein SUH3_07630 [Pseudosulfitobacter pseudonitzschiae]
MHTKAIDLQPDCFSVGNYTALCQQAFDVGRDHSEAIIGPGSIRDVFARETQAFQACDILEIFMMLG